MLDVQNLNVQYHTEKGNFSAVSGLSLSIEEGEITGLVGQSGCGKSTAVRAVMGISAENAEVEYEKLSLDGGIPIPGHNIAMIFQEPMTSLNPLYTCGSQIAEAILLHNKCSKQEAWERAVEILKMVGVPSPEKRAQSYPHELSGGMRQRVMIAIALSCNPRLLIADEPTTALDPTIQAQILKLIHDMQKEKDMSVLLITHDMGIVAENCDRVAVMYAGQILEIADVKTIFGNPAHPYTIGLLKAIPKLDEKVDRLYNIRGMVPRFNELPNGCTFGPRCDFCDKKCEEEAPQLVNMGDGHLVRCHYAGYLPERGI